MVSRTGAQLDDPETLTGRWSWTRHIEDRRADEVLRATGVLELVRSSPDLLTWTETGVLTWPDGTDVDVRRGLRVERRVAGWWVTFSDGRDFHPWTPGAEVVHPCGADTYRGLVGPAGSDPGDPGAWQVVWTVSGPTKDYTTTTSLRGWVDLSEASRRVEP